MLFLSLSRLASPPFFHPLLGVELRCDLFSFTLSNIKNYLETTAAPVLLTLRRASQGGNFQGREKEREELIVKLLDLEPSYFDLEYDMRQEFIKEVIKKYTKTKFILSYHNFEKIPDDLEIIYNSMQQYSVYTKIAVMVQSTNDALKMLLFRKNHPNTSIICMGEKGEFARVLARVCGNLFDYAYLDEKTAPGQLSLSEMFAIYHYPLLDRNTKIYGLIGDPVEKSIGHIYHNQVFRKNKMNAIYVKMVVKQEELDTFIFLAKEIGIQGLSVTMPLKEKILPFVDAIDASAQEIQAINTLLFTHGAIKGTNTDGVGALDAIEKKMVVKRKKIVLLGAGGAARSIAFEAKARGASVCILNRTLAKAQQLAEEVHGQAGTLEDLPKAYDILINCSPDLPIDLQMQTNKLVMDVVYSPKETPFLQAAAQRNCTIVYGEEMYVNQAKKQTDFWIRI